MQQQLDEITRRISELLEQTATADIDAKESLLSQLQQQIERRAQCLDQLLQTELAQDPEWLKRQLDITRALAQTGKAQLKQQHEVLGGYRKGRQQASVYQNIELGK